MSDSLQIAYEFMEHAQQLADAGMYDEACEKLDTAKSYAYQNTPLLDNIRIRREAIVETRQEYIKKLEEEAANIFRAEQFDSRF